MQDRDAANTMPGGGDMSVVNELSVNGTRVFADSLPEQQVNQKFQIVYSSLKMTFHSLTLKHIF